MEVILYERISSKMARKNQRISSRGSIEHDRLHRMIDILHSVCELNDFHIEEHVVLRDKRTGKVWR